MDDRATEFGGEPGQDVTCLEALEQLELFEGKELSEPTCPTGEVCGGQGAEKLVYLRCVPNLQCDIMKEEVWPCQDSAEHLATGTVVVRAKVWRGQGSDWFLPSTKWAQRPSRGFWGFLCSILWLYYCWQGHIHASSLFLNLIQENIFMMEIFSEISLM